MMASYSERRGIDSKRSFNVNYEYTPPCRFNFGIWFNYKTTLNLKMQSLKSEIKMKQCYLIELGR